MIKSLNEIMEDVKDYCENTRCSKCPLFSTGCFENSINTYDDYLDYINEPLASPYDIISDYQMYKGDEVR